MVALRRCQLTDLPKGRDGWIADISTFAAIFRCGAKARLETIMQVQSHLRKICCIATCIAHPMSGFLTAPAFARSGANDIAKTLDKIQKLASLKKLTPPEIRKEFHANLALRNGYWEKNTIVGWDQSYSIEGDFGFLEPEGLDVTPAKSYDIANQSAIFTLTVRIDGQKICISPNDLSGEFDHKLTTPKFRSRPYEHRHCENGACVGTLSAPLLYNLNLRYRLSITFAYYRNYCLDEITLKQSGVNSLSDRERKSFEFINPTMTVSDAKAALASRGFYCDAKMIPGPSPGNDAFVCEAALPPNAFAFKSQSVEIWQDPDGKNITGVLIISSREPPKRVDPSGS